MARDYIPHTEADLLQWSSAYSQKITASPTSYGLVVGDATQLATLQSAFATALAAATDPETRGGSTIHAKEQARVNLVDYCRFLARQIQGTPSVTDQQKYDLGLTVRDTEPTPVPIPAHPPQVTIVSVSGRTVRIRMRDVQNPTRRGRPEYVAGATIVSYVGTEAPTGASNWKFEGNTTHTTADIQFPDTVPAGATVWIACFWYNSRAMSGPACVPISTNVQCPAPIPGATGTHRFARPLTVLWAGNFPASGFSATLVWSMRRIRLC